MCDKPDVYQEVKRKANKLHYCSECGRAIYKGEDYLAISGLWGGSWGNFKHCQHCQDLYSFLLSEDSDCLSVGEIYSELIESEYVEWEECSGFWLSNHPKIKVVQQYPLQVELLKTVDSTIY